MRKTAMKARFSIRDLFFVVVIVAMAVGWYLDNRRLHKKYDDQQYQEQLKFLQAAVKTSEMENKRIKGQQFELRKELSQILKRVDEQRLEEFKQRAGGVERIPVVPPLFERD